MPRKKTKKEKLEAQKRRIQKQLGTTTPETGFAYKIDPKLLKANTTTTKPKVIKTSSLVKTNIDPKYIVADLKNTLIISALIIGGISLLAYLLTNNIIPNSIW